MVPVFGYWNVFYTKVLFHQHNLLCLEKSSVLLTTLTLLWWWSLSQGDLGSYLQKKGRLSPSKVLRFALDIARHVFFFESYFKNICLYYHFNHHKSYFSPMQNSYVYVLNVLLVLLSYIILYLIMHGTVSSHLFLLVLHFMAIIFLISGELITFMNVNQIQSFTAI